MALTTERYAEIDAGATYISAIHALGAITALRHMLASDLEQRKIGDDISPNWPAREG